jgi:FAD/FMN-containing dehydrogenase
MTTPNGTAARDLSLARELRSIIRGQLVLPGTDTYDHMRQVWNGAVDRYPALIALCAGADDVQAAVRAANVDRIPVSVRGGGHDWAGRALRDKGLVIDLSAMRDVKVDAAAQTATIAGGATAKDVVDATAPYGLTAVTGSCGGVGMTGLTLGGGYGALSGRYGLALDNIVSAEVVLADGRIAAASATENADLFWALRGGGGNFGVVTAMRVRLHPVRHVLAGLILFPWSQAIPVLRAYAMAVASAPDELSVMAGMVAGPDGDPTLFLAPTWSGEEGEGEAAMAMFECLGTPSLSQVGPMSCAEKLTMFDEQIVSGRHYDLRTRWVRRLTPPMISMLVAGGTAVTSRFSAIVLHHFHGAAARVPVASTAFGLRQEHFLVEIIAAWEPNCDDNGDSHRRWAETMSRALAPVALPGGYPNLLGPDHRDQIELAYGGNVSRLLEIKQRFDPDNVFSSAIPLPVTAPRAAALVTTSNFA